ncbi:MAG: endonuclease III domain-containing protein [Planctomycetota bacterium]
MVLKEIYCGRKELIYEFYLTLYKKFGTQKWWPAQSRFEIIIGAILTQNTSWNNAKKAIENLKRNRLLKPEKMFSLDIEKLKQFIQPAGFFNQKATTIKNFVMFLFSTYKGNIPSMLNEDMYILREKLLQIKGIGKETADSIILYACEKPVFVVDKYTRRIFFRHKIINDENVKYEQLQEIIQASIPTSVKIYNEYHALLVRTGKNWCKKIARCDTCPLNKYLLRENV